MSFDIESIKRKMLVKYPFFGSVVANVDYRANKNVPTAGTDGKVIYYNPDFLSNLSIDEQVFVFAHEVCHIAFNHILRSLRAFPERIFSLCSSLSSSASKRRSSCPGECQGVSVPKRRRSAPWASTIRRARLGGMTP